MMYRLRRLVLTAVAVIGAAMLAGTLYYASPLARCPLLAETGPIRLGSQYRFVDSGGLRRCYLLYVPSTFERRRPMPLVFSLHGFASNPWEQRLYAKWEQVAESEGVLVAYPQGSSFPLRWNVGPQARLDEVDDVQLIEDVIADIDDLTAINPRRVYVSGFSNGGHMAHQIACRLEERIAAVGIVAGMGADPEGGCEPSRPVPVIAFSGTADPMAHELPLPDWLIDLVFNVSVEKARPGPASVREWAAGWSQRNRCDRVPLEVHLTAGVLQTRYADCAEDADVVLYTLEGAGHAWPGGSSIPFLGKAAHEVDATALMWEFFQAHAMPAK